MKKRRSKPRRGRVIDKKFLTWMHTQPCLVLWATSEDCSGRITFHHVRRFGEEKNDRRGVSLCVRHHLQEGGSTSIHSLGKVKFQREFGVDLEKAIRFYNKKYESERAA